MKLLQKADITKQKALERHREIEEGKKLAERVDALRELSAKEEAQLRLFRDKAMTEIRVQLAALSEESQALTKAVAERKKELAQLLLPLDEKWAEVTKAHQVLNEWEDELNVRQFELVQEEKQLSSKLRDLHDREYVISQRELLVESKQAEHDKMLTNAREVLAEARNQAQVLMVQNELITRELVDRDRRICAREAAVTLQEKKQKETRTAMIAEQVRVNDMRKMLEKELNG